MYIVSTISKNSYTADKIEEILRAGSHVLRYNFSHGTPGEMLEKISVARKVIHDLGLEKDVKILADLPGNKIRLGSFPQGECAVVPGQRVRFQSEKYSDDPSRFIPVDHPGIGRLLQEGQEVSCGDGEIGFRVIRIVDENAFEAEALNAWHIPALKALNIGRGVDALDHLTPQTIEHIRHLSKVQPDWVAFSFVNSREYLLRAKQLVAAQNPMLRPGFVSKVETPQAMEKMDEIIKESDIILFARGDFGLTCPIETLGLNQKRYVQKCKEYGKEIIVSTQILDSLLSFHTPSRAEILDLTNIVLDGADGIMLAKETGISRTPGYSVTVAKRIIEYVEQNAHVLRK